MNTKADCNMYIQLDIVFGKQNFRIKKLSLNSSVTGRRLKATLRKKNLRSKFCFEKVENGQSDQNQLDGDASFCPNAFCHNSSQPVSLLTEFRLQIKHMYVHICMYQSVELRNLR
jgi:hypothetical protein